MSTKSIDKISFMRIFSGDRVLPLVFDSMVGLPDDEDEIRSMGMKAQGKGLDCLGHGTVTKGDPN